MIRTEDNGGGGREGLEEHPKGLEFCLGEMKELSHKKAGLKLDSINSVPVCSFVSSPTQLSAWI